MYSVVSIRVPIPFGYVVTQINKRCLQSLTSMRRAKGDTETMAATL